MPVQIRQEGGPQTSLLINGTISVSIDGTISVGSNDTFEVGSNGTIRVDIGTDNIMGNSKISVESNGMISVTNETASVTGLGNGTINVVSDGPISVVSNGTISIAGSTASNGGGSMPAAAIGGALGGVIAICLGLIVFLLVRLSRARRPAQTTMLASEQQHLPYMIDDKTMSTETAEYQQLSQRLAQAEAQVVRLTSERNLAASLVPTTTRDGSDYLREVELINGNIRQLSMRLATSAGVPSHIIRISLCQGLWVDIFDRFDCALDIQVDACFQNIYNGFENIDQARIWKAMTIRHLPVVARGAYILRTAEGLVRKLQIPLQPSDLVPLVSSVAQLSRQMAEDASLHTVTHYASGGGFIPDYMESNNPSPGGPIILGTEAFGFRQQDGYIALRCTVRTAL